MAGVNGDEFVIDEGCSRFGLRRLHVLRAGKAVDRKRWEGEKVNGGKLEAVYEYEDKEVGMHHLRLYWRENNDANDEHGANNGEGDNTATG